MNNDTLSFQINDLLPQTQCGQCGFKGCYPYAQAIAEGVADINQCPPGGEEGIAELALLLNVAAIPLNTRFGFHKPGAVAVIVEENCIGCTKCIEACPVDAILGAAKLMHTVITEECTGCELCVAPCPVDCIIIQTQPGLETLNSIEKRKRAKHARQRYEARCLRKEQQKETQKMRDLEKQAAVLKTML